MDSDHCATYSLLPLRLVLKLHGTVAHSVERWTQITATKRKRTVPRSNTKMCAALFCRDFEITQPLAAWVALVRTSRLRLLRKPVHGCERLT